MICAKRCPANAIDDDIIGLSAEGKELTKIDGNISTYFAEQKPFKGYK